MNVRKEKRKGRKKELKVSKNKLHGRYKSLGDVSEKWLSKDI